MLQLEPILTAYSETAKDVWDAGDIETHARLEEILLDEEGHKARLELQRDLIFRIGDKTYSAKLITTGAKNLT